MIHGSYNKLASFIPCCNLRLNFGVINKEQRPLIGTILMMYMRSSNTFGNYCLEMLQCHFCKSLTVKGIDDLQSKPWLWALSILVKHIWANHSLFVCLLCLFTLLLWDQLHGLDPIFLVDPYHWVLYVLWDFCKANKINKTKFINSESTPDYLQVIMTKGIQNSKKGAPEETSQNLYLPWFFFIQKYL